MKTPRVASIGAFFLELAAYAVFIAAYFFAVLFFLSRHLNTLFQSDKPLYAVVSLALIIGQGIVLESVTTFLLKLAKKDSW